MSPPPQDHALLIGMMIGYFILIIFISSFFGRKIETLKDYFLAGRTLGAWPVALSFVAGWFGAGSTIGSVNAYNEQGLGGLWFMAIPSFCACLVITYCFARRVSDQVAMSQPEAIEQHYGRFGRFLLSCVIFCSLTSFLGSQLVAGGALCSGVLGWDLTAATIAITLAVVSYSMVGGYFAVVITDIAQFILFTLGLVILAVFCALAGVGTPDFYTRLFAHTPPAFWDMGSHLGYNLALLLTFVLAWSIAPEMWQRMTSTRNRELSFSAARSASLILGLLFGLVAWIGLHSPLLVQTKGNVLVDMAMTLPHSGLSALVLVGMMAAITSTMDSSLNVGSLTLSRDLYQGFFRPHASQREMLWVSRIATLLVPLPAIAIALHYQSIIQILWISADIYASTMFFPVIGLLYLKQPGRLSGILAMLSGGLVILLSAVQQYHLAHLPFTLPEWPYRTLLGVFASGTGFAVGWMIDRLRTRQDIEKLAESISPPTQATRDAFEG